jgi:hypothetical protein
LSLFLHRSILKVKKFKKFQFWYLCFSNSDFGNRHELQLQVHRMSFANRK